MTLKTWLGPAALAATIATVGVSGAAASAPPVGPIPKGPVSQVKTAKGYMVAVALPRKSGGRVWRLARSVDPAVLRQVSEATVGRSVVVVFRATGKGTARIVFALTRGETSRALASVTYLVRVT